MSLQLSESFFNNAHLPLTYLSIDTHKKVIKGESIDIQDIDTRYDTIRKNAFLGENLVNSPNLNQIKAYKEKLSELRNDISSPATSMITSVKNFFNSFYSPTDTDKKVQGLKEKIESDLAICNTFIKACNEQNEVLEKERVFNFLCMVQDKFERAATNWSQKFVEFDNKFENLELTLVAYKDLKELEEAMRAIEDLNKEIEEVKNLNKSSIELSAKSQETNQSICKRIAELKAEFKTASLRIDTILRGPRNMPTLENYLNKLNNPKVLILFEEALNEMGWAEINE